VTSDALCVFTTPCTNQVIAHPDRPPVPFTPKVQKLMQLQSDEEIKDADKSDTTFSAGSLQAALRAAGSVVAAIDAVVDGTHRNAFCCVRPPGHHAGANGLESDAVSCGFCIFNNVAIGALHALRERSSVVKKVAVIDFDVHHGNGTQAIFEGIDDPSAVFFFSIHLCEFAGLLLHHCPSMNSQPRSSCLCKYPR
jgi:acetoin utilization deacetylase AcuC-like enzyme